MLAPSHAEVGQPNHPLAFRMAAIAFIKHNVVIACIWGSFSVLLSAVETRLGVGRELSTLAAPAAVLAAALCAPIVGTLASRVSLRLIMLTGGILCVAGFILLALSTNYYLYLLAYGLLLGPSMGIAAVTPATLVTRWYSAHRGRALGIVCAPVVVVIVPLASNWTLHAHGVPATYEMLAVLSSVAMIADFFVVDSPPPLVSHFAPADIEESSGRVTGNGIGMMQLLSKWRFWALTLAFVSSVVGSIILTAHMVPMARTWGLSARLAATLLSIQAFAGIAGAIVFGLITDRLGGVLALAILSLNTAVLWALLLLQPPFIILAIMIALIGVHGAGAVPVLSVAISEIFGREGFSRAYGLVNLVNLPFYVLAVPVAAIVFARTGSYRGVLVGEIAFLALGGVLALTVMEKRAKS